MKKYVIFIMMLVAVISVFAANFTNLDTEIIQPDGNKISCYSSGDEFYNWLHDEKGFVIIQNGDDGYYYYGEMEGEDVKPSQYLVDSVDPGTIGLQPNIRRSQRLIDEKRAIYLDPMRDLIAPSRRGILNNIVVYIRFADQDEFPDPRSYFDQKFNSEDPADVSLKGYYNEVSYGELELNSFHYPECDMTINLSYQDSHTRDYFLPISMANPNGYEYWERTEREHQLLADAIDYIADEVPEDLDIDYNDDGFVDNVCFIIRGVHSAWADLLWAHRWVLYNSYATINGLQVYDYTFQPENQNNVRTLAHEMFHALGAPDLYHYDFDGISPAGPWDIMESGFVNMGAHMKYKYGGWINEIPLITESGYYSLNPLNSAVNNCFRINSPNSTSEYFVLEYRKRDLDTYERNIPGSGLLVTRVINNIDGNADGPPDEVYYYRPEGTTSSNGSISHAFFSEDVERTAINDYTNPSSFLAFGGEGGLNIHSIGESGEQIEFYVDLDGGDVPPVIEITSPEDDAFLPVSDLMIEVDASTIDGSIEEIELFLDDESLGVIEDSPYEFVWNMTSDDLGNHQLKAIATADNGMQGVALKNLRIIDPTIDNWFRWYTDNTVFNSFGRGSIPIKVAADFELGELDYYVKNVSINLQQDPYGTASLPGLVQCSIVEFDENGVSDNVLLDIGSFVTPMDGPFIHPVNSSSTISGRVALIMDIDSYQNIVFDMNGVTGHSWLTEPDRPWVDAISRGMIGAAEIAMEITTSLTDSEDDLIPESSRLISSYPNPFYPSSAGLGRSSSTTISFSLTAKDAKNAKLEIYNIKGQLVKDLSSNLAQAVRNSRKSTGIHNINWDGTDKNKQTVTSGIYFYKLEAGNSVDTKKMILLK